MTYLATPYGINAFGETTDGMESRGARRTFIREGYKLKVINGTVSKA
jgi:hypothetical protein